MNKGRVSSATTKRAGSVKIFTPKEAISVNEEKDHRDGKEMELAEFVTEYRRKVQGYLWGQQDKMTVADLVKLAELERETQKYTQTKGPRELRVVWIDKKSTT